jgi:hypothetical protein
VISGNDATVVLQYGCHNHLDCHDLKKSVSMPPAVVNGRLILNLETTSTV